MQLYHQAVCDAASLGKDLATTTTGSSDKMLTYSQQHTTNAF